MLFRVGLENGPLALTRLRQGNVIFCVWTAEQPRDKAVFAFIDRRRGAFAPHGAINRLYRHLPRKGGCVSFPARYRALAGLARRRGDMQSLLDRLVGRFDRKPKRGANARGSRWTKM